MASYAIANDDVSHAEIATKFVAALQHQRFKDAAAMFAPEVTRDTVATEHALKRIDDCLGGFSTIHPVANLPNGRTLKFEVPAHKNSRPTFQKFVQVRYASTASDGKPVFYEVDLTADGKPPQILSFGLHFPASDAQLTQRANQLIGLINR
jgi:phospholipid N-methyltransferase